MIESWLVYVLIALALGALAAVVLYVRRRSQERQAYKLTRGERMKLLMATEFKGAKDAHLHVNRDGSVATALGECPQVWPEDMRRPDDQD